MLISLIHPSRGRPFKAKQTIDNWMSKSSKRNKIEHIISLDKDDRKINSYKVFFKDALISDNLCVVEATNKGASISKGEILIYLSDDFDCPNNWDSMILEYFKDAPLLLKVDDKLQPFYTDVVTIPIINRLLYDKLGYFLNPLYKSMYVDQDLYWTCYNNGWLQESPELKFQHNHWANGKARKDETYIRTDSFSSYGKTVYEQRKSLNFPL